MQTNPWLQVAVTAMRALPKNALSRLAGHVAAARLPRPLQTAEIRLFGLLAGVDFGEVRDPLDSFDSLQEFFTRRLTQGARPVAKLRDSVAAPCDGSWGAAGGVESGRLLQIKERPYSLGALLGDDRLVEPFEGGCFATFYLSPRDYHRFHAPCRARIAEAHYIPGTLWPVNRIGVEGVDGLFAQNERICAHMRVDGGDGTSEGAKRLCVVAVGATMVGKVRLEFDDLETNIPRSGATRRTYPEPDHYIEKGAEWGRFEFGSTLVMIAERGLMELAPRPPGTPIRLGEPIGTFSGSNAGSEAGSNTGSNSNSDLPDPSAGSRPD